MNHPDEIEALDNLRLVRDRRDEAAFGRLYDAYSPTLYRVCLLILKNEVEAQEALQDSFLHLWNRADGYDPARGRIYTWLCVITRSKAIDRVRRNARLNRKVSLTPEGDLEPALAAAAPSTGASPDALEQSLLATRSKRVRALLAALSPPQALVIKLAYYEGLSQTDIAARLNQPLGTVKTRMRLATKKLAGLVTPEMKTWL